MTWMPPALGIGVGSFLNPSPFLGAHCSRHLILSASRSDSPDRLYFLSIAQAYSRTASTLRNIFAESAKYFACRMKPLVSS